MKRWHPFAQLFLTRQREFYREPSVLFWVYGFPLFLAIGLGIAFSGGPPEKPTVAVQEIQPDLEKSGQPSRVVLLQQLIQAGGLPVTVQSPEACRQQLRTGKIALYVEVTPDGYHYVLDPNRQDSVLARYQVDALIQRARAGTSAAITQDMPVTEPGNRYIDFLIPGLMGLNLMGGGLWGVGFVIVDMRVRKLLKRLLATPMRRRDLLLSILASRVVFLVPEMLLLALAGYLLFHTPVRGQVLTLIVVILVGGSAFAGVGLLIASRSESTETVSGLINLVMLPMWMLSGTFFSSKRFPDLMQPLIQALPLTQLNEALREVLLEGTSLAGIWSRLAILGAWAIVSFALALRWFRWR